MLTTSSHNYLIKRRQSYYYRRRVPVLLKAFFTGKEFVISLQTKHFNDAKKLANRYDDYFEQLLCQEKLKNMEIIPSEIHGFKRVTSSDGSTTIEFTPDDTRALVEAGLTSEQINTILLKLIDDESKPEQKTQSSISTISDAEIAQLPKSKPPSSFKQCNLSVHS